MTIEQLRSANGQVASESTAHEQERTGRHRRARFRRAVHAADRAAHPRAAGLLRDSAVQRVAGADPRLRAGGHRAFRRPVFGLRLRPRRVCDPGVLSLGVPVLGICYGLQWIAHTLGGKVRARRTARIRPGGTRFARRLAAFRGTAAAPEDLDEPRRSRAARCRRVSTSPARPATRFPPPKIPARRIFAVQFHPEVRHTERGTEILRNFVFAVCGARPNWSGASFIAETVEAIRQQVGGGAGHLRAERRRGFGGGRGAGASRHRRPPDQRLRGYRPAAQERVSARPSSCSRSAWACA